MGFFQNDLINFVVFEMSKKIIKQEVDLVLLLELFFSGRRKTEQSNLYVFNEYHKCQNSTIQIAQCMVESFLH